MESNHRAALQKAYLFQDIGDEEYACLISCLSPQIKCFSKNETLFFVGDLVEHIGIILSGTAFAYSEHIGGDRTIMSMLTPMKVFGEIIASTSIKQSPVTICAASNVTAAFIRYENVHSMCTAACMAHRVFIQNLLKVIGDKYFSLFERINILREKTLRLKIMAYLYSLRGGDERKTVTIPYTKTILADYLLANRSALSKELRKMENDGLITVNSRTIELLFIKR